MELGGISYYTRKYKTSVKTAADEGKTGNGRHTSSGKEKVNSDIFTPTVSRTDAKQTTMNHQLTLLKRMAFSEISNQANHLSELYSLAGRDYQAEAQEMLDSIQANAEATIAEDGYWGVEQTAGRLIDFAKMLAGDNVNAGMIETLRTATQAGFGAAAKVFGGTLSEVSEKTYTRTMELFDAWAKECAPAETEPAEES